MFYPAEGQEEGLIKKSLFQFLRRSDNLKNRSINGYKKIRKAEDQKSKLMPGSLPEFEMVAIRLPKLSIHILSLKNPFGGHASQKSAKTWRP